MMIANTKIMYAWKFNNGKYCRTPKKQSRDGWGYSGNCPSDFLTASAATAYKSDKPLDCCPYDYEHLTKRGGKCVKIEITFKEIEK